MMSPKDLVSTEDYNARYVAEHFLKWREKQKNAEITRERVKVERAARATAFANDENQFTELELKELSEMEELS
jgi:hypothetical protein